MNRRQFLKVSAATFLASLIPIPVIGKVAEPMGGYLVPEEFAQAILRQNALMLDNLGITINITEAHRRFAAALGKHADDLTHTQERQAVINEVLSNRSTID